MKTKRVFALICSGILLILFGLLYLYFFQRRPIGSGPAGPAVHASLFSSVWSDKKFLLVGLGDSVTAGFGARRGYSYLDLLATNSPDDYPDIRGRCLKKVLPGLELTNLAVSGSTSGEHQQHQLPRIRPVESNTIALIAITTGGNDLIHNYGRTPPREQAMYGASAAEATAWIQTFDLRLEAMVTQINAKFPAGCHIFLATIFDPTDGAGDAQHAGLPAWKDGIRILESYNAVIRKCAEKHAFVHIVDVHKAFLGHGIHCTQFWSAHYDGKDPHYWYYTNLEDPNERGYDVIRRLYLLEIAKIANQFR